MRLFNKPVFGKIDGNKPAIKSNNSNSEVNKFNMSDNNIEYTKKFINKELKKFLSLKNL